MKGLKKLIALLLVIGGVYWLFSGGIESIMKYFYPLTYSEEITESAAEYGLDEYFVRSVIKTESGYEERATSGVAHGLMQLTDDTASWISEKTGLSYERRMEPSVNIKMGCYYLSYLKKRFTDTKTVLAAYNAGPNTASRWLDNKEYSKDGVTLDKIPYAETAEYVKRVQRYYKVYKWLYEE